jgi:hypothetical protein
MTEELLRFARDTRSMMAARQSAFDDIADAQVNAHGYSQHALSLRINR